MSNPNKYLYECDRCGESLVAVQRTEGTVPMMIKDCPNASCDYFLARDTGNVKAIGREPTHELVEDPDLVTDKLKLQKINQSNAKR